MNATGASADSLSGMAMLAAAMESSRILRKTGGREAVRQEPGRLCREHATVEQQFTLSWRNCRRFFNPDISFLTHFPRMKPQ
jgi:hypothetical protein